MQEKKAENADKSRGFHIKSLDVRHRSSSDKHNSYPGRLVRTDSFVIDPKAPPKAGRKFIPQSDLVSVPPCDRRERNVCGHLADICEVSMFTLTFLKIQHLQLE